MNTTEIERGWSVYTEDGKRAGDVVEAHPHYLLVSRGLLVVRDLYVPRYAVSSVEERKVHLAITDERLRHMGWTAPPPPPPPPTDSLSPRIVPPIVPEPSDFSSPDVGPAEATFPSAPDESDTGVADSFSTGFEDYDAISDDYADLGVLFGASVEVDGEAHLAVQRLGDGPAVVLIHGWGFDHRVWDYVTIDLPSDYTVVTYDARGYGRSTAPWGAYSVEQAARDLRVLLRTLDLSDATLVGLDLGAAAALHYALNGGRRAARLVLIAPAVLSSSGDFDDDGETSEAGVRQGPLWTWHDELRRDRPRLAARIVERWLPGASPETAEWLRGSMLEAAPHALLRSLGSLAIPDVAGSLAAVDLPVRVLCGREDPLTPLERAEAVAAAIPGATFTPLDIPGHLPMLVDPERIVAEIRAAIVGEQETEGQEEAPMAPEAQDEDAEGASEGEGLDDIGSPT